MTTVVVADDHPFFRDGVSRGLTTSGRIRVVGEAEDGVQALDLIRSQQPDVALLAEDAEKALFHAIVEVAPLARSHFQNEDYTDALRVLAGLRAAVDRFFDEVMVMAEEPLVRQNRLALLGQLAGLMNQVADISRLSA